MKKILLTLFSAIILLNYTNAQVSVYTFAGSSGTYTPITGGTTITTGIADDSVFSAKPIGFAFNYNGANYNQFGLNVNGWISLGATAPVSSYFPISTGTTNNVISALGKDLQLGYTASGSYTTGSNTITMSAGSTTGFVVGDVFVTSTGFAAGTTITAVGATTLTASTNATTTGTAGTYTVAGNIQYLTSGTAPTRTCTIQWVRARRYGTSATGGQNNLFNFQIRLTETSNVIAFVYGPFQTNTTTSVYQVGLHGSVSSDFNNRKTSADWSATTAGALNTDTCRISTTVKPASGQTYTFTPPPACSGTPAAGTASGPTGACSGVAFNLVLTGYTPNVSGLTFQWQSSTISGGTYTSITGGTTSTFSTSQTAAMFYRCVVTCSGGTGVNSNVINITMNAPSTCHCVPASTNCTLNDVITNVTIGTINNTTTCGTAGYSSYTTPTATLNKTIAYPIAVTVGTGGTEYAAAWIDYNQNGVFETTEFTSLGSGNGVTINSSITISGTATVGNTKMRVRLRYATALTGADACLAYTFGETEDYVVTIGTATACSGTPTPGTASAPTAVCSTINFNLVLTGYTPNVSGLTFQWTSSSTFGGTYSNITGATTSTYTTSQTATTYYMCVVTCSGSAPAFSNIVTVSMSPPASCYCAATNGGSSCITNLTLNTLNRTSAACENSPNYYTLVPSSTATTTVTKGLTYPLSVKIDSSSAAILSVWIDYNQNSVFDSSEWKQVATNALVSSISTVSILIPTTAVTGQTGMRIRSRSTGSSNGATDACTAMFSGETEDYTITIATPAGIEENTLGNISVYPNPTTGLFTITAGNANFSELTISVVDIQGKEVYRALEKNNAADFNKQINLEGLAKGIYVIRLNTGNGAKIQKLIIQ